MHICEKILYKEHYDKCLDDINNLSKGLYFPKDINIFIKLMISKFPDSINTANDYEQKLKYIMSLLQQKGRLKNPALCQEIEQLKDIFAQFLNYLPKCGHRCSGICHECNEKGTHEPCKGKIPFCIHGHDTLCECCSVGNAICDAVCGHPLPCGHACGLLCCQHNNQSHLCTTQVTVTCPRCNQPRSYTCGHPTECQNLVSVKCYKSGRTRCYICNDPTNFHYIG